MTKRKLPPAKNWRDRKLSDWNALSFTEYLRDTHRERYGIDYVPGRGGWRAEQGMIKREITEHGTTVVKRFIDECFREYKPSRQYPGLNFTFMYTYMRGRVMPKVLVDIQREERRAVAEDNVPSADEIAEWL